MSTKWRVILGHVSESSEHIYNVYYRGDLVAEIRRDSSEYSVYYCGESAQMRHDITGDWEKETIQQLLLLIKQRLKSDYSRIEYKLNE